MNRIVSGLVAAVLAFGAYGAPVSAAGPSYELVKRTIAQMPGYGKKINTYGGETKYDLMNCQDGSDFVGAGYETQTGIYADMAHYVSIWETDLPALGYPARVWRPWVSRYEALVVATENRVGPSKFYGTWSTAQPKLEGLQGLLMTYRSSHPKLKPIVVEGGCGGDNETVKVVTQPLAAQVVIIPTFYYELCRIQRIDPNDATRCDHWREVLDGNVTQVAGDYHYLVRWHDGKIRKGTLSFDKADNGTVTLRKP